MSRTKKIDRPWNAKGKAKGEAKEEPTPKKRGRPAKAPTTLATATDPHANVLVAAEIELKAKYPTRLIVPGSLWEVGRDTDHAKKRTIAIRCEKCDAERRIATSDLFQVSKCVDCARKKAKKEETAK